MTVLTQEVQEFVDERTLELPGSTPPELDAWAGADPWLETAQRLEPLWEL
jgi:hypothetical protein